MRHAWAHGATLGVFLGIALPTVGEAQTCVTVCQEATWRCADRCMEVTSESFAVCEGVCARSYFVDCFKGCVKTGEVHVPDPYPSEGASAPPDQTGRAGRKR